MKVIQSALILLSVFQKLQAATDTCRIYGDPHVITFDGQQHHYQGQGSTWFYVNECSNGKNVNAGGTPFQIKCSHRVCYGTASCLDYIEVDFWNAAGNAIVNRIRLRVDLDTGLTDAIINGVQNNGNAFGFVDGGSYNIFEEGPGKIVLLARWDVTSTGVEGNNDFKISLTAGTFTEAIIEIDDYWMGRACGLCGQYDGSPDNEIHIPGLNDVRRRQLLQTFITLDNEGMDSWSAMLEMGEIWERTFQFGDAWATDEEIDSNVSTIFFPSAECIDGGTAFCELLWTNEESCSNCKLMTDTRFISFEAWLQGCIYDACAAGAAEGMKLEELTYDEANWFGYFDAPIGTCDAQCDTFGACPSECDDLPCDCRDDYNCRVCQPDSTHHCPQCDNGYFKKTDRNHACYPCQQYAGEGCMFCQNFRGCGQCSQGYTLTKDEDCDLFFCQ